MTSIGKALLFGAAVSILFTAGVRAQTIAAASCNASDVQKALNSVTQASATVSIPAGTCTWTSAVSFTVPSNTTTLIVQGTGAQYANSGGGSTSGTDSTVIIDNVNHASAGQPTLGFSTVSGQSLRITGIFFEQNSSSGVNTDGVLQVSGSSTAVRIDHCHFYTEVGDIALRLDGSVLGVADHDFFAAPSGVLLFNIAFYNGATWNNTSDGQADGSWADTDHWGTSKFFFAEDDYFDNGDYVTDCTYGGRYVVRHSTLTNVSFASHGTAGTQTRGCRAAEIYDNTFTYANNSSDTAAASNSGGVLFWGNNVSGNQWALLLSDPRQSSQTYAEVAVPNEWGYCGTSQTGSPSPWDGNSNSTGYACLDQPGRGSGDLLTGTSFPNIVDSATGTESWPHEALDPIYVWDNTYNDAGYSSEGILGNATGNLLADNRDYYQQFGTYGESGSWNGTAGINQSSSAPSGNCTAGSDPMTGASAPGVGWWDTSNNTLYVCNPTNTWTAYYAPYTYPHPLTQSTSAVNPPTNLSATAH